MQTKSGFPEIVVVNVVVVVVIVVVVVVVDDCFLFFAVEAAASEVVCVKKRKPRGDKKVLKQVFGRKFFLTRLMMKQKTCFKMKKSYKESYNLIVKLMIGGGTDALALNFCCKCI